METPDAGPGLATLGEDLLLLAIRPNGTVGAASRLGFGLMGSELVRLAAAGRIEITGDRIVVRSAAPAGDPELDAALDSIAGARKPPRPRHWVGHPRAGIRDAYLSRLVAAQVLSADRGGLFGGLRYRVCDTGRAARARAVLDAIARSQGPVEVSSAAVGGLACAVGLDSLLYPGFGGRAARKRLEEIAAGRWTSLAPGPGRPAAASAAAASQAAAGAADLAASAPAAAQAAAAASAQAAASAAVQAAASAAVQAATDAAVQASVHAATAAATHAAVHAAQAASPPAPGGHH